MKYIVFIVCFTFGLIYQSYSQTVGVAITSMPEINSIKYPTFNTFITSYNELNKTNADLMPKSTIAWRTSADFFLSFIYIGLHRTHNKINFNDIDLGPYKKRVLDMNINYTSCNIGYNFSKNNFGVLTYVTTGMSRIDLNTYMKYYNSYSSYGQHREDGYFSGNNIIGGWGLRLYYIHKFLIASAGFTKMGSIFPENLHDFDPQKMNEAVNSDLYLASDWVEYNSVPNYEYNKGYVTSYIKTNAYNVSIGFFIGETN